MARLHELNFYSLAEAKAQFSRVVDDCVKTDTIITKNGVPKAVLMDYEKYVKINRFLERVHDLYLIDAGEDALDTKVDDLITQIDEE